jgi:hypothetical protein
VGFKSQQLKSDAALAAAKNASGVEILTTPRAKAPLLCTIKSLETTNTYMCARWAGLGFAAGAPVTKKPASERVI